MALSDGNHHLVEKTNSEKEKHETDKDQRRQSGGTGSTLDRGKTSSGGFSEQGRRLLAWKKWRERRNCPVGRSTSQRAGWGQSRQPPLSPCSLSSKLEAAEGRRGVGKTSQGQVLTHHRLVCSGLPPPSSPALALMGQGREGQAPGWRQAGSEPGPEVPQTGHPLPSFLIPLADSI